MKFLPGNAQHIGARSEQQDSFGFSDPSNAAFVAHAGVAAVVADGMGGLANGKAASQTASKTFLQAYESKVSSETIPDALLRSLQVANNAVLALARQIEGVGTTLAAAVTSEQGLFWISVGDSRVYLLREDAIQCVTTDHIYARDLDKQVARGQTTRLVAESHPERASL
ncbi:MAG: PP2C family protein-serine/threonine phosphatase, partial [Bryobacteraceae bacterium]